MDIDISTPALLFPAISLLLLAYTNRFLALAQLIRDLDRRDMEHVDEVVQAQIANLRKRVLLIRNMQSLGILSLLLCVVCMFALFMELHDAGRAVFGVSLLLMVASLALSVRETHISVGALDLQLESMRNPPPEA